MSLCRYLTSHTTDPTSRLQDNDTTTHHQVVQVLDQLHHGHHLLGGGGLGQGLHQGGDGGGGELSHGAVVAGVHALTLPLPRGRVPGLGGAPRKGGGGGGREGLGGQAWLAAEATVRGDHRVLVGGNQGDDNKKEQNQNNTES